jgi:hypothetical protein
MAPLVEHDVRLDRERSQGADISGLERECTVLLDMEDLDNGNAGRPAAVDERLQTAGEGGDIVAAPVWAMAERLLGVDDEKGSMGCGHGDLW